MASFTLGDKIVDKLSPIRGMLDRERMVKRYGKRKSKKVSQIRNLSRWLDRIRRAVSFG